MKPENIFYTVSPQTKKRIYKIADFGISSKQDSVMIVNNFKIIFIYFNRVKLELLFIWLQKYFDLETMNMIIKSIYGH